MAAVARTHLHCALVRKGTRGRVAADVPLGLRLRRHVADWAVAGMVAVVRGVPRAAVDSCRARADGSLGGTMPPPRAAGHKPAVSETATAW